MPSLYNVGCADRWARLGTYNPREEIAREREREIEREREGERERERERERECVRENVCVRVQGVRCTVRCAAASDPTLPPKGEAFESANLKCAEAGSYLRRINLCVTQL